MEEYFQLDFLKTPYKFNEMALGETEEEKNYRKWCLQNKLYLNTLNDVFNRSLVAHDCIHLPNIVTNIHVGVKFHGLFNQLKQEYVSARYMIYDGISNRSEHYSDKEVYMYNTLDYPVYGLAIEKIKCAYRSLYSLFDRIAYFINDYYEIGIKERDVSYRSIWMSKRTGKYGYNFDRDLKNYMTENSTYNHPLIGLYWLYKDIGKKKVKYDYLDPSIKQISEIRNSLEHRYLKVHDIMFSPEFESSLKDSLAMSISFSELKHAAMDLLNYAREAIILLVLTVHREEQIRDRGRDPEVLIAPMYLVKYEDEWKQIFYNV